MVCLQAQAQVSCQFAVSRLGFPSVDTAEFIQKPAQIPTVETLPSHKNNERWALFKRQTEQWRSVWSPDQQNIQSDPRNLIILLGEVTARKFGAVMLGQNLLQLPRGKEFSEKIQAANKYLKKLGREPIAVSFYDSISTSPVVKYEYLEGAERMALPVASDGHYLTHDVAAHYGAILLPRKVMSDLAVKAFYFKKYANEMETMIKKYPPAVQKIVGDINQRWLTLHEMRVDVITGNFTLRMVDRVLDSQLNAEAMLEKQLLEYVRQDSGATFTRKWMTFLLSHLEALRPELPNFDQLVEDIANYSELQNSRIPVSIREPLNITALELMHFVDQRRLDLSLWDGK